MRRIKGEKLMKIFDTQYLIIGAGLAGTALAFLLRRSGSE